MVVLEEVRPATTECAQPPDVGVDMLETAWGRRSGLHGWIACSDHKEIGLRFIVTAFVFFLLGGILALLMRIQLAVPDNHFLGPDLYNQLFTTHGTTMMFLFAVPVMQGMGIYLVPLMIGMRNVSFPRHLNFAYYLYLAGGLLLYVSLVLDVGPDMGWFSYVPLAGPQYVPGYRMDVWSQMISMVEISSLAVAVKSLRRFSSIVRRACRSTACRCSSGRIGHGLVMILFAMPVVTV